MGENKYTQDFCDQTGIFRNYLEGTDVQKYNIKLDLKINTSDDMDWINRTENRTKWRVLLNMATKFGLLRIREIS